MKTQLFTILLLGWDIRNRQIFHSKNIKNHYCNPNMCLMPQITGNIKKCSEMVSGGTPRIHEKSLKTQPGTFQGPSLCICDPLDCKTVPKVCRRTSKGCQNCHLETPKGVKKSITQHITNRFPFLIFIH